MRDQYAGDISDLLKLNYGGQSLGKLAASQGVHPVTDFEALLGHPASDDESVEEFEEMLREWRSEGVLAKRQA
jgi:hypothetical protein